MSSSRKWLTLVGMVVVAFFVTAYVLELDAYARVGGGRSIGSRGSRSSYRATTPSSPSRTITTPATRPALPPAAQPQTPQTGGFWRTFAGGLAGGLLGGLLFSSLGFGHGGGFGGGGIGLLDIILLGAIIYLIWRFFRKRRLQEAAAGAYYQASGPQGGASPAWTAEESSPARDDVTAGIAHIRQMDPTFDEERFRDAAMDLFFKIQGAWANRDLSSVRRLLTEEMYDILDGEARKLRAEGKINRLENIAVRSVDIVEAWQEGGRDYVTVRFLANLLDYVTDEKGNVLEGSKTDPVKFEEYWTLTRPVGPNTWSLTAIDQAS
ncbi:MAG TPA: Tim44 domain-containing protein [Syntrophales bacterium]|nr:Tim44 domain-containing protein [Syntrophales bacterium]HRV42540.1 Tim44 domain-containing protein [Syntrophales bacterium]